MRYTKLIRPHKRDEIRRVRQYFIDAGLPSNEVRYAQIKKIPDATKWEHEWGEDFVLLGSNEPTEEEMIGYRERRRLFNKDPTMPDCEIISVPMQFIDVRGKTKIISVERLAEGAAAAKMADFCEKPRDGYNDKIKRLREKSKDKRLKARLDSQMREIERKARERRRRK